MIDRNRKILMNSIRNSGCGSGQPLWHEQAAAGKRDRLFAGME